jgi:hypothetical protein
MANVAAPIEKPLIGTRGRVLVTWSQVKTVQGFTENADGSRTHFEHGHVRRAIGRFILRSGLQITFTELLAFRDVARA